MKDFFSLPSRIDAKNRVNLIGVDYTRILLLAAFTLIFVATGFSQTPCDITCVFKGFIEGDGQKHELSLEFFVGRESTIIGSFYTGPQNVPQKYAGKLNKDNSFEMAGKIWTGEMGLFTGKLTPDMARASGRWTSQIKDKTFGFEITRVVGESYWDVIRKNRGFYQYKDIKRAVKDLDKVLSIDLDNQGLNSLPPGLSKLTKINSINLAGSKFTRFPTLLSKLITLDEISLADNQLREIGPEIGKLKNLKMLIVDFNHLKSLPKEIGHLKKLLYLDVSFNQLSRLPDEIKYLTKLQELHLEKNNLSEGEKERIRKLLPNCKIQFNLNQ